MFILELLLAKAVSLALGIVKGWGGGGMEGRQVKAFCLAQLVGAIGGAGLACITKLGWAYLVIWLVFITRGPQWFGLKLRFFQEEEQTWVQLCSKQRSRLGKGFPVGNYVGYGFPAIGSSEQWDKPQQELHCICLVGWDRKRENTAPVRSKQIRALLESIAFVGIVCRSLRIFLHAHDGLCRIECNKPKEEQEGRLWNHQTIDQVGGPLLPDRRPQIIIIYIYI